MRAISSSRRRHCPNASSGQEQDRVIVPARRRRGATAQRIGHPLRSAIRLRLLRLECAFPGVFAARPGRSVPTPCTCIRCFQVIPATVGEAYPQP